VFDFVFIIEKLIQRFVRHLGKGKNSVEVGLKRSASFAKLKGMKAHESAFERGVES